MLHGKWAHTKPAMWRNVTNEDVANQQGRGTDFDEAVLMENVCQATLGQTSRVCQGFPGGCARCVGNDLQGAGLINKHEDWMWQRLC